MFILNCYRSYGNGFNRKLLLFVKAYKPTPIKTPDGYGYAIAITVTVIVTIGLTLLVGISMILLWHFGHKKLVDVWKD